MISYTKRCEKHKKLIINLRVNVGIPGPISISIRLRGADSVITWIITNYMYAVLKRPTPK